MIRNDEVKRLRRRFDETYNKFILNSGFFEVGDYYERDRERYWRTFLYYRNIDVPRPAHILEIGGGQLAIIANKVMGDFATVGDVSGAYSKSVTKAGLEFSICNLLEDDPGEFQNRFDLIALLEVIEHLPVPGYIVLSKVATWLKPGGFVLVTTPNLFRLRNLARMFVGHDIFDRFLLPDGGQGLGHQLEYSADHLRWQLERAGLKVVTLAHDQLGQSGHSKFARAARRLTAPLRIRDKWKEELVAVARRVG